MSLRSSQFRFTRALFKRQPIGCRSRSGCVPFVILCGERTGSTMLVEYLDGHPQVRVYNEPFNGLRANRDPVRGRRFSDTDDGAWAVDTIFRQRYFNRRAAVGFKMIYTHAPSGPLHTAWERLGLMEDLVLIDLVRENLLEVLVSHRIADFTGRWQSTLKGARPTPGPVHLSPYDCLEYFERCEQLRAQALACFSKQRRISETYEALKDDPNDVLGRIWPILGVEAYEPNLKMRKQESMPMCERIENYSQLEMFMRETPYARFFTG